MPTLDWLNRANAFTTAARVPYRLLEQVSTHSASPSLTTTTTPQATTDNLLIQGDNLAVCRT